LALKPPEVSVTQPGNSKTANNMATKVSFLPAVPVALFRRLRG
jgi:hypothetical protein